MVPQGSILAPTLFNIFTSDIPHSKDITLATFADDTAAIISNNIDLPRTFEALQNWFNFWKITRYPIKSAHTTFLLRPGPSPLHDS